MPTARQEAGKPLGRIALLQLSGSEDKTAFVRELLASVFLKSDAKVQDAAGANPAPSTWSIPGNREVLFTRHGGIAVRMLADEDLETGDVVTAGEAAIPSVKKHVAASKHAPVGVVYEGTPAGTMATVVVAGTTPVKILDLA